MSPPPEFDTCEHIDIQYTHLGAREPGKEKMILSSKYLWVQGGDKKGIPPTIGLDKAPLPAPPT